MIVKKDFPQVKKSLFCGWLNSLYINVFTLPVIKKRLSAQAEVVLQRTSRGLKELHTSPTPSCIYVWSALFLPVPRARFIIHARRTVATAIASISASTMLLPFISKSNWFTLLSQQNPSSQNKQWAHRICSVASSKLTSSASESKSVITQPKFCLRVKLGLSKS